MLHVSCGALEEWPVKDTVLMLHVSCGALEEVELDEAPSNGLHVCSGFCLYCHNRRALEEVELNDCAGLTPQLQLSGPSTLRVLSLCSCRALQRITVQCPQLTELRLGQVGQSQDGAGS